MDTVPDMFLARKFLVWYGLLQTTSRTTELIGSRLKERTGMSLASLEALTLLRTTENNRLRMSELADELLLSRGGVTRLVARLESAGHVHRERPAEDQRAVYAVLTDAGLAALTTAYPVFDELLQDVFLSALSARDTSALNRAWIKVLRHVNATCHALVTELERADKA